ncbi:hypothetical protein [Paludisphaera mucosa]|uniref:Uncharacterized protein n=1 Tax=Paludisphaera mucosa TaxID=3030827 RepID=A0ABT6FL40_9BACT|nr:hypothetical protein [Paludisphaera mucosa]MDG3008285.1 hypothetical protein [Paludisphaera mucosa]
MLLGEDGLHLGRHILGSRDPEGVRLLRQVENPWSKVATGMIGGKDGVDRRTASEKASRMTTNLFYYLQGFVRALILHHNHRFWRPDRSILVAA